MRVNNASFTSLVLLLTIISTSFGFDLKCAEFVNFSGKSSVCTAKNLYVTSTEDAITSVNRNYEPDQLADTLKIQKQNVKFVPQNIAKFFPNLQTLEISNSNLVWIEQADIKELVNLRVLHLEGNMLSILEKDLFQFNTELEQIYLSGNQLEFIYHEVFFGLQSLQTIQVEGNRCVDRILNNDYDFREYLQDTYNNQEEIRSQLETYCQSWQDLAIFYKDHFNIRIYDLQSEKLKWKKPLIHQYETCDTNLNAALVNLREQKSLINANVMTKYDGIKPSATIRLNLACEEDSVTCDAESIHVPFANLSIECGQYKDLNVTSLRTYQEPTLFLPKNLFECFPQLSQLSVVESGLYEIDFSVFEGLDLVKLNLTKNKIHEIPVDTFLDLENLQELDLSFNKFRTLHDDVFASLKNLQTLRINDNYLSAIKFELLKNLVNLRTLCLQNNQLKYIGATLLTPFTNLQTVDLSGNSCINMSHPASSLSDLESTIIDNCIAPVELNCQVDQHEAIEKAGAGKSCNVEGLFIKYPKTKISQPNGLGAVDGLNNLIKVFFVSNQSMEFFPFQLSNHFPNLQRIEIQQSKLTALHRWDWDGFLKLTEIVIHGNNFSTIGLGTFDAVPQLELLDLSSNNIVTLPSKIFAKLTRLHTLLLSDNRIQKFTADILPRKNVIDTFSVDNNRLEFIETKIIRFLRKAKMIDLTGNVCIDMEFAKTENSTQALVELSGAIDLNCSVDDSDE